MGSVEKNIKGFNEKHTHYQAGILIEHLLHAEHKLYA